MRKEVEIKIEAGRDAGKVFKVEEMPAVQMDRWITRALCMLGRSGSGLSMIGGMTMEDLLSAFSKLDFKDSEPLLDELLSCCSFKKDGTLVKMTGSMVDSVVEDWTTIFKLRIEALKLNLGFLEEGGDLTSK
ncbi:MAG: hypothetical protein J6S85_02870 [Methanobrevibacter sp.]|nr:hypothetical protein [Methanobrevibacter sp.]